MKSYKVTAGVLAIGQGARLHLTPEQARPRRHKLEPVADSAGNAVDGLFVASDVLQFKAGETLKIDGDVPKSHAHLVEDLDPPDETGFTTPRRPVARGAKR